MDRVSPLRTGRLFRATLDNGEEPLLLRRHGVQYLALHTHSELVAQVTTSHRIALA